MAARRQRTKFCGAGHIYDASLSRCPLCTGADEDAAMMKTVRSGPPGRADGITPPPAPAMGPASDAAAPPPDAAPDTESTVRMPAEAVADLLCRMTPPSASLGEGATRKEETAASTQVGPPPGAMTAADGRRTETHAEPDAAVLEGLSGPVAGLRHVLRAGVNRLGALAENEVVVTDPFVSARHAIIDCRHDAATGTWRFILCDLYSRNGTFLQRGDVRSRVEARPCLEDGDVIQIGPVIRFILRTRHGTAASPAPGAAGGP